MSTDFRAAIGATRAALVHPEGEGLGLAEIDELCAEFGFHYDDDQGETLEILQEMIAAALSRWGRPVALAQSEGQSMLNVNLKLDTSPECLKRLCDGLTKAVTPSGGYEAVSPNDSPFVTHGIQIVQGERWIPQYGCDSLENTLDAIKYRIGRAVVAWWATALVSVGSGQLEREGLTNDEALRRGRPATPPAPKFRNPTMDEVMDMARSFQLEVSDRGALLWLVITAIAVWGDASATPPAPEAGELTTLFAVGASCGGGARLSQDQCARAATLLQQQEARIAGLRSALADCGRAEGASISDDCSDDFLLQVPAEVRLAVAKAAPAVVPVAMSKPPGKEDCDEDGFLWAGYGYKLPGEDERDSYAMWMLMPPEESNGEVWLPAHAIPLPQAGEVDG